MLSTVFPTQNCDWPCHCRADVCVCVCVSSWLLWVPRVVGCVCGGMGGVCVLHREAEILWTWELCSCQLLTWWAPPDRGGVVRAVHELSFASPVPSLCWRKSRDPDPPSRHHLGLSAVRRSVCPTECSIASSVSQDLPLCCNNIAAGGGVGWVVEVGGAVFSKGPAVATLIYDHEP